MKPIPLIKAHQLFNAQTVTRDELVELASKFHNDSYGMGKYLVGLIQQIAELRGFAPIALVDVDPYRTHWWTVRPHNTKENAFIDTPNRDMSTEIIDFMNVNGQGMFVALHYLGKRPEPVDVAKKIKEIGARSFTS